MKHVSIAREESKLMFRFVISCSKKQTNTITKRRFSVRCVVQVSPAKQIERPSSLLVFYFFIVLEISQFFSLRLVMGKSSWKSDQNLNLASFGEMINCPDVKKGESNVKKKWSWNDYFYLSFFSRYLKEKSCECCCRSVFFNMGSVEPRGFPNSLLGSLKML